MNTSSVEFPYTATYHTLGSFDEHTEDVWVVCHGYGQLSQYFINKFKALDNGKSFIIAPGGLHRFYQKGFTGRVGASWMTSEQREMDIDNYLTYLNGIYDKEIEHRLRPGLRVNVLGFSQGAATVSRWIAQPQIACDRLVLWAGLFPHDLDMKLTKEKLAGKETFLVYGLQDPLINHDSLIRQEDMADNLGIDYEIVTFEGVHDIDEGVLDRWK